MLFWLEGDVEGVGDVAKSREQRDAIGNLVDAAKDGRHGVFGSRDFLIALAEGGFLPESHAAYLRLASQWLTQEGRALQELPKVRVSASALASERTSDGWIVPLAAFSAREVLEKPLLVAENIRDAVFFQLVCEKFFIEHLAGYRASFIPYNGGGDTTAEVLETFIRVGAPPVFCVVDSDRSFAGDALGQTALRCDRVIRKYEDNWRVSLWILGAKEVENLIHRDLRNAVLGGMSADHQSAHQLICDLPDSVSLFIDLKKGDRLCRFYERGDLQPLEDELQRPTCAWCRRTESCPEVPGFGAGFLGRIVEALREGVVTLPDVGDWPSPLAAAVRTMGAFGLAKQPLRAV